jgi:hypothetical protein
MEPLMIPASTLDFILTRQLAVAWAGEGGEEPRLGWWRTFLVHEDGGQALFEDLLPQTWQWAVFQGVREAARRADAEGRGRDADPDALVSLYHFGFEVDERLDQRVQDLKRTTDDPLDALPALREVITEDWDRDNFAEWVAAHGEPEVVFAPAGLRLKGAQPSSLETTAQRLIAALSPLQTHYPLPHFRGQR